MKDETMITQLRANGRMPLTDLSRITKEPVSTLHEKLKKYVKKNILKPTILLNFDELGYKAKAYVLLAVEPTDKEKLLEFLRGNQHVNSLYRINNGWHVMMECVAVSMQEMENFIEQIETQFPIKHKEVHYILEELAREAFLSKV